MESLFAGILFNGNRHELVHTMNIQVYTCQEYAYVVQIIINSCHPLAEARVGPRHQTTDSFGVDLALASPDHTRGFESGSEDHSLLLA